MNTLPFIIGFISGAVFATIILLSMFRTLLRYLPMIKEPENDTTEHEKQL